MRRAEDLEEYFLLLEEYQMNCSTEEYLKQLEIDKEINSVFSEYKNLYSLKKYFHSDDVEADEAGS